MPELPNAETYKRYFDATSLYQPIREVDVNHDYVLGSEDGDELSADALADALHGQEFSTGRRHGKYLLSTLSDGRSFIMHFGMSGSLNYFKSDDDISKFDRVLITFNNGYHLAFHCPRVLGNVYLFDNDEAFLTHKNIGPDVLRLGWEGFNEILAARRGMIKPTLMDQHIMAGIGNIYSDEILFQTRLHPETPANALDEAKRRELFNATQRVLNAAIDCDANPKKLPNDYLLPHRIDDEVCPSCGEPLTSKEVGGRTAYFCEREQERLEP